MDTTGSHQVPFERIDFKFAAATKEKRKAYQQYYRLPVEHACRNRAKALGRRMLQWPIAGQLFRPSVLQRRNTENHVKPVESKSKKRTVYSEHAVGFGLC